MEALMPPTSCSTGSEPAGNAATELQVADLAALAQQGDGGALEQLIERFEAAVYRLCYRILGDVEQAQDARQETFVRMLQSIQRFETHRRFSTWLFGIAAHVALDLARHESARPAAIEDAVCQATEPIDGCILQEDLAMLDEALVLLAPRTRALLALRFQENLSPAQISKVLDVSANQVRVDLWRARMALRRALKLCKRDGQCA